LLFAALEVLLNIKPFLHAFCEQFQQGPAVLTLFVTLSFWKEPPPTYKNIKNLPKRLIQSLGC